MASILGTIAATYAAADFRVRPEDFDGDFSAIFVAYLERDVPVLSPD